MNVIDHDALLTQLASAHPPQLVHGGGTAAFTRAHLPGSLAIDDPAVAVAALQRLRPVVVYGTDPHCTATRQLAQTLAAHGFTVGWYAAGTTGWQQAGLPVEGTTAPPR